jgi:EAL domain-containing protein (putative c-di-GMP-specific phosphodiesterase class I)
MAMTAEAHRDLIQERENRERLMAALQQDEFVLHAQGIQPLGPPRKERLFQEVFIRSKQEDEFKLPPGTFFPVFAECGLLPYLDRWVVNRLARWVRGHVQAYAAWEVPRTNVNLSRETLTDPDFGRYVRQYAENSWLAKGAVGFEIPWDAALRHAAPVRRLMGELRPCFCTFTLAGIDGSEESLAALSALAPNYAKISSTTVNPAKVSDIQRRCHAVGCKTIGEHVENPVVLEHFKRTKIDFVQGFAIAPVKLLK